MKRLLIVGMFIASNIFAIKETVTTYLDPAFTNPSSEFEDGSLVYVRAIGTQNRGFIRGTATASSGSVKFWFSELGNTGIYTGGFKISKTEQNKDYEVLNVLPDEIGTISVDLDNDGDIGLTNIKSIGHEEIRTFNQSQQQTSDFLNNSIVDVKAYIGFTRGDPPVLGTLTCASGYINLIFADDDNDGTYSASFNIDKDGTNTNFPPTCKLSIGEIATITLDLNRDGRFGTTTVRLVEYSPPILNLLVSDNIFSPYTSGGIKDTIIATFTSSEDGTYTILIDGTELETGTIETYETKTYEWNGWPFFEEGSYTLLLKVKDLFGNESSTFTTIYIDSTPPTLSLSALQNPFSPQASEGIKDSCEISFTSSEEGVYEITIDGEIVSEGTIVTNGIYIWDGSLTTGSATEGTHLVDLTIEDLGGNASSMITYVTIDRTYPLVELSNNTGGDCFYRDEVVQFTLKKKGEILEGPIIVKLISGTITRLVQLQFIGMGTPQEGEIYHGYYTVVSGDFGTFTIYGSFTDLAGNPPGTFGTISLDGSRARPSVKTWITRVGFIKEKENRPSLSGYTIVGSETDSITIKWANEDLANGQKVKVIDNERKHIWVSDVIDRSITLNNGLLYYGMPISDYRDVIPSTSNLLRDILKKGDNIIFSLEAVKLDEEFTIESQQNFQGSITIFSENIEIGNLILVSNKTNTWIGTSSFNGSFTISNQNLYSGPIVSTYSDISLLSICPRVSPACGGDSKIDIGSVVKSIPLSDDAIDGIGILSSDIIGGDGVYSNVYTIKEGDDTNDALLYGHFIFNKRWAENRPYQDGRQKITIDAKAPVISNNSVSPTPFNPWRTNLSIKYNLSEKSCVKVKIYNSNNNLIRILESPDAQFGENVTLNWDGKNNGGIVVPDGHYTYIIEAEDLAGNRAVEKEGEIVLTWVEIAIENLNVAPNPFWPKKEIPDSIDTVVSFRVVLYNSKESQKGPVEDYQLNNLGFDFSFNRWYSDVNNYFNSLSAPYALLDLEIYDEGGEKLQFPNFPDLSNEIDLDPFLYLPYYADGSHYYEPSLGSETEADKGDGDTGNDYGNLVPFNKDGDGNYYNNFSYGLLDWDLSEGTYIFRVGAQLVSIEWYMGGDPKANEETWHASPCFHHYGLKSEIVDKEASVEPPEPPVLPDTQPPVVENTDPPAGQVIDSGSITSVWAVLKEKPDFGACGVDFKKSEIFLVDKTGQRIAGEQKNDGESKIFWFLDLPLTNEKPGSYTIKVKPVDKKGNGLENDYQKFEFIMKDIVKPNVYSPFPPDGSTQITPFSDDIEVFLSEIGRGESGIDWEKSSLSLKKGDVEIPLSLSYYVTPNTNNNAGKLIGKLNGPLTEDGTYTISVKAYDLGGNQAEATFYFVIPPAIHVIYNGDVYLDIPYGAEIIPTIPASQNISVGTATIFVELLPDTFDHKAYKLVGSITKFYYGTDTPLYGCKFTKDVKLTLFYPEISPSIEEKLGIYGTGSGWTMLGGTIDKTTKKISLLIPASTEIKDMYGVMYNEDDPPEITHTPPLTSFVNEWIEITATIIDRGVGLNLGSTTIYYQYGGLEGETITMTPIGTSTFKAEILCDMECQLTYSLNAFDNNGNIASKTYEIDVVTRSKADIEKGVYVAPNPAKGSCKFKFYLLENANVKVEVYTIVGERVWSYEASLPAGDNNIPYNCINKEGDKLGTGLYIYKLTIEYPTKKESTIKKMVIIKQ